MIQHRELQAGEEWIATQIDTTDFVAARLDEHRIRGLVIQELWRRVIEAGLIVVHGPEIVHVHRAKYPGDNFWMGVAAICRE